MEAKKLERTRWVLAAAIVVLVAPLPAGSAAPMGEDVETLEAESPVHGPPLSWAVTDRSDRLASWTALLDVAQPRPGVGDDEGLERVHEQRVRGLLLADRIVALEDAGASSRLAQALDEAALATLWQMDTLDRSGVAPVPLEGHRTPSEALLDLVDRWAIEPSAKQAQAIRAADELDEPLASALARTVDAFLVMDTASRIAFEDPEPHQLPALRGDSESASVLAAGAPATLPSATDEDLAPVLSSRLQLLQAVEALDEALDGREAAETSGACSPLVDIPPAVVVDLQDCDSTYSQDVALLIDAGGSDEYLNNAGGSGLAIVGPGCPIDPDDPRPRAGAAALVDLGAGQDSYGDPQDPRECGANGGGWLGTGSLIDGGGSDVYAGEDRGVNGGGIGGVGFLLDAGGDDAYTGTEYGVNGGSNLGGVGLLVDAGGHDAYNAEFAGANGAGVGGVGALLDTGGDDIYDATDGGVNGGGVLGVGLLLDTVGGDVYVAGEEGVNGGGWLGGMGSLIDLAGHDTYLAEDEGVNGGAEADGLLLPEFPSSGFLFDAEGDDTYVADDGFPAADEGVNGGGDAADLEGVTVPAVGTLIDASGTDTYEDDQGGTGTDKTVVPKGTYGAQVDLLP